MGVSDLMGGGGAYHSNASSSTKWLGRIPVSLSSESSVLDTNAGSSVLSGKIEKADENVNGLHRHIAAARVCRMQNNIHAPGTIPIQAVWIPHG